MIERRDETDPVSKARRLSAPSLPKRFYKQAETVVKEGQYVLQLDGRTANSPGRNRIIVPFADLAAALADEWNGQGEFIDPATMPVTRLANTAIDGVAPRMNEVRADILSFAGTDALCYRAEEPEGLVAEQSRHWDPVLHWAEERLDARFVLAAGIVHVAQPQATMEAIEEALQKIAEPFVLAGLHVATTLTGSALLALALHRRELDGEQAWVAAHVDEDWNIRAWGGDVEAEARRAKRYLDFRAAELAVRGE